MSFNSLILNTTNVFFIIKVICDSAKLQNNNTPVAASLLTHCIYISCIVVCVLIGHKAAYQVALMYVHK